MTEQKILSLIAEYVKGAGSLRKAAATMGCSPTFLGNVLHGKYPPTKAVLAPLGYECVDTRTYRRVK